MSLPLITRELHDVVTNDRQRNHRALTGFDAVNSGNDIDGVRAKHRQHAHVNIVERPEPKTVAEPRPKRLRNNYCGVIVRHAVNHQ